MGSAVVKEHGLRQRGKLAHGEEEALHQHRAQLVAAMAHDGAVHRHHQIPPLVRGAGQGRLLQGGLSGGGRHLHGDYKFLRAQLLGFGFQLVPGGHPGQVLHGDFIVHMDL